MKRSANNLRKYKQTCREVIKRADGVCEAMIDGRRCGVHILEPRWINFLHRQSRNGRSDEWILDPNQIIFGCAEHHVSEEQTGKRVESVEYEEGEPVYIPDEQ